MLRWCNHGLGNSLLMLLVLLLLPMKIFICHVVSQSIQIKCVHTSCQCVAECRCLLRWLIIQVCEALIMLLITIFSWTWRVLLIAAAASSKWGSGTTSDCSWVNLYPATCRTATSFTTRAMDYVWMEGASNKFEVFFFLLLLKDLLFIFLKHYNWTILITYPLFPE